MGLCDHNAALAAVRERLERTAEQEAQRQPDDAAAAALFFVPVFASDPGEGGGAVRDQAKHATVRYDGC
jgi:hypothetical protein